MNKFLKCSLCGNLVEIINDSHIPIVCCGKNMETLVANNTDGAIEKHVPVVNIDGNNVEIVVGETLHPMLNEHYIMWIHVYTNKKEYHFDLLPNSNPRIVFNKSNDEEVLEVLAYCNLHGLWKNEN